jgi:hypothetical protein
MLSCFVVCRFCLMTLIRLSQREQCAQHQTLTSAHNPLCKHLHLGTAVCGGAPQASPRRTRTRKSWTTVRRPRSSTQIIPAGKGVGPQQGQSPCMQGGPVWAKETLGWEEEIGFQPQLHNCAILHTITCRNVQYSISAHERSWYCAVSLCVVFLSHCFALSWPVHSCKWELVLNWRTWLDKGEYIYTYIFIIYDDTTGRRNQGCDVATVLSYHDTCCNVSFITCNMQYITCNMQYITCNMQYITCNMQYITCNMQYITCNMHYIVLQHAVHNIATCST